MQKMLNVMNMEKLCRGCDQCTCGENMLDYVDKTLRVLEESELLLRDVLIDLLDRCREIMEEIVEAESSDGDCAVMMQLDEDGELTIVTEGEAETNYPEKEFSEVAVIFEDQLVVAFDPDDVVSLGDTDYLIGPMLIFEMDENGNDANIDRETITKAVDYVDCNFTEIHVDDSAYPAFRLI